jgi:hypothetical protein
MRITSKNLQQALRLFSIPACAVVLSTLAVMASPRFLFSPENGLIFYIGVAIVYATVYVWWASIATTLAAVGCYVALRLRRDTDAHTRRSATVVVLVAVIAFAISLNTLGLMIAP